MEERTRSKEDEDEKDEVYVGKDQIVVAWKDFGPMYEASNLRTSTHWEKAVYIFRRRRRRWKWINPNITEIYNTHMGGVDLLDSMVMCYAITTRNRKRYWALYNWYLNWLVQACCLYPKVGGIMGMREHKKRLLLAFIRSCVSWGGQHQPRPHSPCPLIQ